MTPQLSRTLVIAGLVLMVAGALDPLEGSLAILAGSALAAAGAFGGRRRYSRLLFTAAVLIAIGTAALVGLSSLGGVGGTTGRSIWWLALCLPYPIGWVVALVGAVALLREAPHAVAP